MTSLYISKSPQEYGWQMLSIVGGGGESHLLVWRCPCKHPLSCYLSLSCLTRVEQVRCIAQTWQSTMEHRGVHCLLSLSPRVPSSHADSESPVMSGKAKGCLWHKQWSTPPPPPPSSHPLPLSLSFPVVSLLTPLCLSGLLFVVLLHSRCFGLHLMTPENGQI